MQGTLHGRDGSCVWRIIWGAPDFWDFRKRRCGIWAERVRRLRRFLRHHALDPTSLAILMSAIAIEIAESGFGERTPSPPKCTSRWPKIQITGTAIWIRQRKLAFADSATSPASAAHGPASDPWKTDQQISRRYILGQCLKVCASTTCVAADTSGPDHLPNTQRWWRRLCHRNSLRKLEVPNAE